MQIMFNIFEIMDNFHFKSPLNAINMFNYFQRQMNEIV